MEKLIEKLIENNLTLVIIIAIISLFLLCNKMKKMQMEFMTDDATEPGLFEVLKENSTASTQFYGLQIFQNGFSSSCICLLCIGLIFMSQKKPKLSY